MKKTLFLCSSLALAAVSGHAATLCSTTFNRTGNTVASVTVNSESSYGLTADGAISNFQKGGIPSGGGEILNQDTIPNTIVTPNSNVSSGGSWSMSFVFTNSGTSDLLISSIDLSVIGVQGNGNPQNGGNGASNNNYVGGYDSDFNKPIDMTLSTSNQADQILTYNCSTANSGTDGSWDGIHTGSFNYSGLYLQAGDSLTITIAASKNAAYGRGCFAGLTGIQINGDLVVPEPATASLGALGLIGLMLRRRRA